MKKSVKDKTAMSVHERDSISVRKDRLMEAALGLFADYGFHGVAVPKIAKAAGIATGSVYNYFTSKEELANELFWFWKQKLKELLLTDFPATATTREQFEFIWQRLHAFTDTYPKAFQFIEGQLHANYLTVRCKDLEEEVFEIGRSFVYGGQAAGVIHDADPQMIVAIFFGAFVQFFKDCRAGRQEWSLEHSLFVRDFCWQAMRKA